MALIFCDGFDHYGPSGEKAPTVPTLITQYWNAVGAGGINITDSITTTGRYALLSSGAEQWISKTLPGTYSRLIGGFRFTTSGIGTVATYLCKFLDVGTNQCNITVNIDGTVSVVRGDYGATVLGTSATSITSGSKHTLAFDITFHGSSGAYTIYLDGISILTGSSKNTITSANAYATVFVLANTTGAATAAPTTIDDLYLFDTSGSTNNAILSTNPVVRTDYPTASTKTQFTNEGNYLGYNYSATTETFHGGAGILFLRKYTCAINSTIQSVVWVPASTSGSIKFKPVIYSDNAGVPNTLLSTGSEIVGSTADTALTAPLTTPQSLSAASSYWIGFITDTSIFFREQEPVATSTNGYFASNTYGSGAPGTAPAMTSSQASVQLYGVCSGAASNWASVNPNPPGGDTSSMDSSTSGNEDLFSFASLPASITTIYAVSVKAHCKKSDTGARTVDLRVKSSATTDSGSSTGQTPGNTYQWLSSNWASDPNTSAAWTASGVNASTAGIKIAS